MFANSISKRSSTARSASVADGPGVLSPEVTVNECEHVFCHLRNEVQGVHAQ